MLTSLLPGLRQLRAPLGAGYLWGLAIWLFAFPHLPPRGAAWAERFPALANLHDSLGDLFLLAGLSFVAYLLGCVAAYMTERLTGAVLVRSNASSVLQQDLLTHILTGVLQLEPKDITRLLRDGPASKFVENNSRRRQDEVTLVTKAFKGLAIRPSLMLRDRLDNYGLRALPFEDPKPKQESPFPRMPPATSSAHLEEQARRLVEKQAQAKQHWDAQLPELAKFVVDMTQKVWMSLSQDRSMSRLAEASNALYDRVDRLLAESEFRMAISAPLPLVTGALLWRAEGLDLTWMAAIGATCTLLVLFLVWQGWRQRTQAMGILVDAVEERTLFPPEFDMISAFGPTMLKRGQVG